MTTQLWTEVIKCSACGMPQVIAAPVNEWLDYQSGTLAQHAFTSLHPLQREVVISGLCSTCFDQLFKEE